MTNARKTIFLVDDEIVNLKIGKNALSEIYNIYTIDSGESVLRVIEKVLPDLMLLDVNMPNMNGYEVIRRVKADKRTADIPVIFLTAYKDQEMELKGLSMGAVDYITKPFSVPLLLKRIELQLTLESQKQELKYLNSNLHEMIREKTKTVTELKDAVLSTMAELVEIRDETTGGHIARTRSYVRILLNNIKKFGLYPKEMENIDEELAVHSCQLHDVGKIAIGDYILLKPAELLPEEFDILKDHTTFGEKVILKLKEKTTDSDFAEYARVFAISHHEKWDGSGYPKGLSGEDIPLLGRIMALADVYDALVEERPYKMPYAHEKAVEIILAEKGKHFDPVLTELFEKIHHEFQKVESDVHY